MRPRRVVVLKVRADPFLPRSAGPVGLLIGYSVMGAVCFSVMISLGEMATYLPHRTFSSFRSPRSPPPFPPAPPVDPRRKRPKADPPLLAGKGFSGYASRFVDPAMGFALGWNYLFKYLIVTPNNITAGVLIVQYWTDAVPVAVRTSPPLNAPELSWAATGVGYYLHHPHCYLQLDGRQDLWRGAFRSKPAKVGARFLTHLLAQVEFWMSLFKVVVLTGLIIMSLVIDLGGAPNKDRIGFRYWKSEPFAHYLFADRDLGKFLGVWAVMVNAL